jgi:ABC-type transport system involved in multi-copper enzyme maturation permease subunit
MNRTPIQTAATLVAVAFLLAGVGGFIPGVTTNAGDIALYGHESPAMLLGIFQVSVLHNIVHLLFGLAGLVMAKGAAKTYLVGGGVLYLIVWLYGLLIDHDSAANFLPLDDADNWLHLVLGGAMVVLGVALSKDTADRRA